MGPHDYRLKALADDALLAGLANIVREHRRVTAEMLAYLLELDERKLFLDLGFASLFEYCVQALGLCESTAGRHIAAARACRFHADALGMVARGELQASALSLMNKHLTSENAAEVFELGKQKSVRKVEELLAARFPRPDVADAITPNAGSSAEQRRPEPLSEGRFGVHFTADREFLELLERVRGLAAHRQPDGDLLTTMKRGLAAYERELEKQRFAIGRKPRRQRRAEQPKPNPLPDPVRKRRRVAAVTREVYRRDEKQCAFVSADGRRCASRHGLQLDHVQAFARGGEDTVVNQRLLCHAHNQQHARRCFGKAYVQAAVARWRRRTRRAARKAAHELARDATQRPRNEACSCRSR